MSLALARLMRRLKRYKIVRQFLLLDYTERLFGGAAFLGLIGVILLLSALAVGDQKPAGTMLVTGSVVNERNEPVQADVIIVGTRIKAKGDADGRFILRSVPEGRFDLIVSYQGSGREFLVDVVKGQPVDLGLIELVSTVEPPQ
jgi:hypothetical protein